MEVLLACLEVVGIAAGVVLTGLLLFWAGRWVIALLPWPR